MLLYTQQHALLSCTRPHQWYTNLKIIKNHLHIKLAFLSNIVVYDARFIFSQMLPQQIKTGPPLSQVRLTQRLLKQNSPSKYRNSNRQQNIFHYGLRKVRLEKTFIHNSDIQDGVQPLFYHFLDSFKQYGQPVLMDPATQYMSQPMVAARLPVSLLGFIFCSFKPHCKIFLFLLLKYTTQRIDRFLQTIFYNCLSFFATKDQF